MNAIVFAVASIVCLFGAALSFRCFLAHAPVRWLRLYGAVVLAWCGTIYGLAFLMLTGTIDVIPALRNGILTSAGVLLLASLQIAYYIGGQCGQRRGANGHN